MKDPCRLCIVKSMCSDNCELLDEFLDDLILGRCNFKATPPYLMGYHIRVNKKGKLTLAGHVEHLECTLHILYDKGSIHSIIKYPAVYLTDKRPSIALYEPTKGVKLYEVSLNG